MRLNSPTPKVATATTLTFALTAAAASGQLVDVDVTFGSDNDGLGGFTQSTTVGTWSTNATNTQLFYDNSDAGGFQNNSLLRNFGPYDTNPGTTITMTGSLTWSSYADDNNRMGLYAFGGSADLGTTGAEESGALSFLWHSDNGELQIFEGIQSDPPGPLAIAPLTGTEPFTAGSLGAGNTITDYPISFEVTMEYIGADIDIGFSMTYRDDQNNEVTDNVTTTVFAGDYTGDFFGFASRARDRGDDPNRTGEFNARYEDFSFEVVPEPSAFALLSGVFALGCVMARRRRS